LFGSWVLEGKGRLVGEINPCLKVKKKQGKVLKDFEWLIWSNFRVLPYLRVLEG